MSVTANLYGLFFKSVLNKQIDFDSDTIKVALTTSTYVPNQDTDQFFSAVTNEVTGTGYTAGGATITSPTVTYTAASNTITMDGGDVSWPTSTITARRAVIYDSTPGTAATNPLIAYVDFGADVSSSGGAFQITWDAAGIATITVS